MNSAEILTHFFAAIWLVNGFVCKVLNLVPRHRMIVGRILGEEHARLITVLIGIAEICMVIWILSGILPRVNAVTQIVIVAAMNILEFFLAPDLLLFGRINAIIAALFILLIVVKEFVLS